MFALSGHLWAPQRRGLEQTISALEAGQDVCLQGPTGSGKTVQAIELMRWAQDRGMGGCFYVNRKLLVSQTSDRFTDAGLRHGIRAADYEDRYDFYAPFQICSSDTERSRVYERSTWKLHDAGLIVVDEAHMQKTGIMGKILKDYRKAGARVVLLTATPIGLSSWADDLIVSGKLQEYRDCKAIVPAMVKSIEQPDLRKVKRNKTGEYIMDGKKRMIYTQSIVGNVIDRWKIYNPDARPTMLYAPGKPESVWLTEQFVAAGVNWCHVDATDAIVDGKRAKLTRKLWDEILERYKLGDIVGLSSRFKLREGIDVPGTYHCILATPIGSLASYIQTVGRVLRYSPETPDHVLITDHGGNYLRHGSPNQDRPWHLWWELPENAISEWHVNSIRDHGKAEPIRCPRCEGERTGGFKCPHCGYEHKKSQRNVIMEDGTLKTVEGVVIKPRRVERRPDTAELWEKMFWGYRKKRVCRTINQMAADFYHFHGYQPPRDLPLMPLHQVDWHAYACNLDMRRVRPGTGGKFAPPKPEPEESYSLTQQTLSLH